MLFVGDLHINSRVKDRVIDGMREYLQKNNEEKNIVFLGDYVYHFSYDREALLALYNFFLELFAQGKNVYVLAGNHDWLGNTFVFQEAKRTFETINEVKSSSSSNVQSDGKIEFITKPKVENIEGEDVLFLPYFIELEEPRCLDGVDCRVQNAECIDGIEGEIEKVIKTLSESKKKNEIISAKVNQILLDYVQKYEKLTVIHHYYIEGISFPGQRGRFYFNDIAISKLFCDISNIKMISGHLHQGFVHKNYFCTGSVWHTSPLETNQIKVLFKYRDGIVEGKILFINPYFMVEDLNKKEKNSLFEVENNEKEKIMIDENFVQDFVLQTIKENKDTYMDKSTWNVNILDEYKLDHKDISISMKVEDVNYEEMYSYVEEELFKKLKDVKLKKNLVVTKDLFDKLDTEGKNLSQGFSDWKGLLKEYLTNKYPEEFEKYLEFLKEEKIL